MTDFDEVYLPREDTYLMEKALVKFNLKNKNVLEIGCGSGYLSIYCAKQGAKVTSVDINQLALQYASKEAQKENINITFIESNLFSNVKDKFDIIFFNPPYLVSDKIEYLSLDGGKEGREIIDNFLKDFDKYLLSDGFVLLLHTDYNNLDKTKKILSKKGFVLEVILQEHIFFEDLYTLKINKL